MFKTSTPTYVMHSFLPSPDHTGDSDSDVEILQELEEKRRQLDEEIARFRATKEKEFREFEMELKSRMKQSRTSRQSSGSAQQHDFSKYSSSTTPPTKGMLTGCEKHTRKHSGTLSKDAINLMKPSTCTKVTAPTISLDRITIQRQDTPSSHLSHTPPTPTLAQHIGRSPPRSIHRLPSEDKPPLTPGEEKTEATFAGLFVPEYIHNLDTSQVKHDPAHVGKSNTQPTSPAEPVHSELMKVQSASLPLESSFSPDLHVVPTKRAYTSPSSMIRRTLPPIIRNVNGRRHSGSKRKHVTFQLADKAIVEPSSSYEEAPSPEIDSQTSDSESITSVSTNGSQTKSVVVMPKPSKRVERDQFGRKKIVAEEDDQPSPDEVGMGMGDLMLAEDGLDEEAPQAPHSSLEILPIVEEAQVDQPPMPQTDNEADGYFSPRHSFSGASTTGMPPLGRQTSFDSYNDDEYLQKRKQNFASRQLTRSTSDQGLPGGSRRRSPLSSPPYQPLPMPDSAFDFKARQPIGSLHDKIDTTASMNVGFFELDEELASPTSDTTKFGIDDVDDAPLELVDGAKKKGKSTSIETGTSVPINIVRPTFGSASNSWMGTFGH